MFAYLNVFNVVVEEQLNEDWNDILLANQLTVVIVLGKNVQSSDGSLNNLFHSDAVGISSRRLRAGCGD